MTNVEFIRAEIGWANGILARPAYVMPNGRDSHDVAQEVKDAALDRAVDFTEYTADGCPVLVDREAA